jgi:hypothetical protein
LATRGYLKVKSSLLIIVTETPGDLVLERVTKGTGALVTQGVEPAKAEVYMDQPLYSVIICRDDTREDSRGTTSAACGNVVGRADIEWSTEFGIERTTAWINLRASKP